MPVVNLEYANEASLKVARDFVQQSLGYKYLSIERRIVGYFFTNPDKRVCFMKNLPPSVVATMLSMFSRMKNPRGLRGHFLDSFLPAIFAAELEEVQTSPEWKNDPSRFISKMKIRNLIDFMKYSEEANGIVNQFCASLSKSTEPEKLLTNSEKTKRFISTWLDKYGHNSIARMGAITFFIEGCSILTEKSIELGRPGAGYVGVSTRYVDQNTAKLYPIWKELKAMGYKEKTVTGLLNDLFSFYREMGGENQDGYFARYLTEKYSHILSEKELQQGVFGECCDVGGNFLPTCTLTSVGVSVSGEAFPQLIKHLLLDATSENIAFSELIIQEAKKVGADQFLSHYIPTESERREWRYLSEEDIPTFEGLNQYDPNISEKAKAIIENAFALTGLEPNIEEIFQELYGDNPRIVNSFDKLPPEFEMAIISIFGKMSFRGWRDLQRMGMATHNRSLVTPSRFYDYNKPHPEELDKAFKMAHNKAAEVYYALLNQGCSKNLLQYILPMGSMVNYIYSCNLRQLDFSLWQRTKPSVNHEVRQEFLKLFETAIEIYPWLKPFLRCNEVPTYIFARGSEIPLDQLA